eukprot:TRINITY_DN1247_c0_g1_i2.p1 TRINITY_DN1247_c0_g1~~TRINITY_DN1247_c0_g1_i2.p1  ORF type:complete len:2236 (+),score=299.45 TRINITY_DN1247_c0_g1_i2:368-7075(+)
MDFSNTKATKIKYSSRLYELLTEMEELLIQYQLLIKSSLEMKKTIFRLKTEESKQIQNQSGEDAAALEEELQGKQTEETALSSKIDMTQKQIEMERIEALDKVVQQNFTEVLHALVINFAKIKVQYKLTIIRMQALTTLKQLIIQRTTEIFTTFQAASFTEELYAQYGFELYWLNLYMIELDKQSVNINELKITYFGQLKKLILQISQEQAANMGEESIFVVDESSSTGLSESTETEIIVDLEGMNKLQKGLIKLASTTDLTTRIVILQKIIALYKQRKDDLLLQRISLQSYIRGLNLKSAFIDSNVTSYTAKVAAEKEEIIELQDTRYNSSKVVKEIISAMQEEITVLGKKTEIISMAVSPFQQQIQIYQYSYEQIQQQITILETNLAKYEKQLNELQSGEAVENLEGFESLDVDGQQEGNNNEESINAQIEQLLINLEDPTKDECENKQIQSEISLLLEEQLNVAEGVYSAQWSAVFGVQQQITTIQNNINQVYVQSSWYESLITDAEDAIQYYTSQGKDDMVEYFKEKLAQYQQAIEEQQPLPALQQSLDDLTAQLILEEQQLAILQSEADYLRNLYFAVMALNFDCDLTTTAGQQEASESEVPKQSSSFIDQSAIEDFIKAIMEKKDELKALEEENKVDLSEVKGIKATKENYDSYKKEMIGKIPSKLTELSKQESTIDQFDISEFEDKLSKIQKQHSFSQNLLVAYAKYQQDSELHKKSIHQTKILRIAIDLIEGLKESKQLEMESSKSHSKMLTNVYERLRNQAEQEEKVENQEEPEMVEGMTGEFSSLDIQTPLEIPTANQEQQNQVLGYAITSTTQTMIDYYWQNEASLSDCEKADLLEDIYYRLFDYDLDYAWALYEAEQDIADALYDTVQYDQQKITYYSNLLQASLDDVEDYEDLVVYHQYHGHDQLVIYYQGLIDYEENTYQPWMQANITYWQAELATDQAAFDAAQAIADDAEQDYYDVEDLYIYYFDLWDFYDSLCSGRSALRSRSENSEFQQQYLQQKTSFIDNQCKLIEQLQNSKEDTEKITIITQLIPIIKSMIQVRISEQVNFTSAIVEIKMKLSSKRGEKSAKEKAVENFKTLDETIYGERITQYEQNLLTVQSEHDQLQSMLQHQIEVNQSKIKNIEGQKVYLAWLEAELVKLQGGYGGEFGKYTKFEVPTSISRAATNQTKIDNQFFNYFLNLINTEIDISARIVVFNRIIFYLNSYITNITLIETQFKSYIQILKSAQSKIDSQLQSKLADFKAKETELNQKKELVEYYIEQGTEERTEGLKEEVAKLQEEYDALQKNLASLKLAMMIYTHSIQLYTQRIEYRTQQLIYLNQQLQLFQLEVKTLQDSYAQQSATVVSQSASDSTEVTQIENYISELSNQEISTTTKILKITKIITMVRSQITVITKKYTSIKFEIQKLTAQQFKLKLSMGMSQAQYDSYMIKINKLETEIAQFSGSEEQLAQLQQQLKLYKQQSETSYSEIQTLNITYTSLQTQIDNYLIEENQYSEKIIKYKQELVGYQGEMKELAVEQKKIEQEQIEKEKEKQAKQEENLQKSKEKIENMKDQLDDKKQERDAVCRIPVPDEPEEEAVVVEEEEQHPEQVREEKEKRTYEPMEWEDEEEKPKEYEPRIDGAQEGFKERIPGNPYVAPKERPEEDIWRKPKTDKRYDYGWEQFMREKEEERKNRNLTLAQPKPRIPYENVEEGVYRIKRRLHDILNYEFGNDEFFVQIKTTVERYMKVLVEKEHVIKQKEVHIKERTIKIENSERRVEHHAEIVKQDLQRCQLDFPLIKKKAEAIKNENYTQVLQHKIQEKKNQLQQQKDENKKAEQQVQQLQEKVIEDEKQATLREQKVIKTYPNEFHYEAPINPRQPRPQYHDDDPLPDYVPTKASTTPPTVTPKLKQPETEKEKEQEKLEEEEKKLDEQIEETDEDPVEEVVPLEEEQKKQEEKKVEEKKEEIKQEEKKIEEQKQKLVEEKEKLDQQIEQCKLDFGSTDPDDESLSGEQKEQYQLCVTNRDQFDQDKNKLEEQIAQYEQLFKELQDEKTQFQAEKLSMPSFQVSGAHTDRQTAIPVLLEMRKAVHKQALWKHINRQLTLVNDLAASNAKQQKSLENQMKAAKQTDKDHLAAIKSMKYIQSFTQRIAARLSLILSEYPEDRQKLREMTVEVVSEIDRLYELAMKQRRVISSINVLRQKQRELLTMKTNCLKAEKLMNQPSFLQNLLQMNNQKGKKNFPKY